MKRLLSSLCIPIALALLCVPVQAEDYEHWSDAAYEFHNVRRIYIDELQTPPAAISSTMKARRLKEYFFEQAKELDDWTVVMPTLPPPVPPSPLAAPPEPAELPKQTEASSAELRHVSSSDPAAGLPDVPPAAVPDDEPTPSAPAPVAAELAKPAEPPQSPTDAIPLEAADSDLYVKATVTTYYVGTGLIPAHMEWESYMIRDVAYDRRGRPHWFSRRISYPVYVPNTYVPLATVGVQFIVYDVKTGKAVSMSEDNRTRGSSQDLYGVYKRIVDRFYKNLKKDLKE